VLTGSTALIYTKADHNHWNICASTLVEKTSEAEMTIILHNQGISRICNNSRV